MLLPPFFLASYSFYFPYRHPFILFFFCVVIVVVREGGGKWREAFNMITNDAAHTHSREKETIVRFVSLCCVPQGRGHGSSSICKEQGGAPFHQAVDLCPVCVCVDQTSTSQTTERQLFFGLDRRFTTHTHDHTRDYTAYEREKKIHRQTVTIGRLFTIINQLSVHR